MENEILSLEKKYWDAMCSRDYETVKSLTKFPCIVAGNRGIRSVDEPEFKKMFEQGDGKIKVNSITGEQVQTGNDHGLIAYLIDMDYNGKSMKCACSSTWIKEQGKWVCAMHTESDLKEH